MPLHLRRADCADFTGNALHQKSAVPAVFVVVLPARREKVDVDLLPFRDVRNAVDPEEALLRLVVEEVDDAAVAVVLENAGNFHTASLIFSLQGFFLDSSSKRWTYAAKQKPQSLPMMRCRRRQREHGLGFSGAGGRHFTTRSLHPPACRGCRCSTRAFCKEAWPPPG